MKIVQAIGTPCSGKSFFLRKFVKEYPVWKLYDIANYRDNFEEWLVAENALIKEMVFDNRSSVIIESAQGLHDIKSINVEFKCDLKTLGERHKLRGLDLGNEELEYYSMLKLIGVRPHVTIDTSGNSNYEHLRTLFFKAIY